MGLPDTDACIAKTHGITCVVHTGPFRGGTFHPKKRKRKGTTGPVGIMDLNHRNGLVSQLNPLGN